MSEFKSQRGMTIIELLISLVVGSIVVLLCYKLWMSNQRSARMLQEKDAITNSMTLASTKIQKSIVLSGLGLGGSLCFWKVRGENNSDTLVLLSNKEEKASALVSTIWPRGNDIHVNTPSDFVVGEYIAIVDDSSAEVRKVLDIVGNYLTVDTNFTRVFEKATSVAYPASVERYYITSDSKSLVRERSAVPMTIAKNIDSFQVNFFNDSSEVTMDPKEVRYIGLNMVGFYKKVGGDTQSVELKFSSIPRNAL